MGALSDLVQTDEIARWIETETSSHMTARTTTLIWPF
jgi:hypothetical protein